MQESPVSRDPRCNSRRLSTCEAHRVFVHHSQAQPGRYIQLVLARCASAGTAPRRGRCGFSMGRPRDCHIVPFCRHLGLRRNRGHHGRRLARGPACYTGACSPMFPCKLAGRRSWAFLGHTAVPLARAHVPCESVCDACWALPAHALGSPSSRAQGTVDPQGPGGSWPSESCRPHRSRHGRPAVRA